MRILGLVVLIVGMLLGIGSNLKAFLDPPSIIIVVTFTLGALWVAGTSVPGMVRALGTAEMDASARADAVRAWDLARQAAVAAGAVGVLIGAVIILMNVDDLAAIGPGLAICILTSLYGVAIGYGICLPCQRYVEGRG